MTTTNGISKSTATQLLESMKEKTKKKDAELEKIKTSKLLHKMLHKTITESTINPPKVKTEETKFDLKG